MPSPTPPLFSLLPRNDWAKEVVALPFNEENASMFNGDRVLDIGQSQSKSGSTTLATLGRGQNLDIQITQPEKLSFDKFDPDGGGRGEQDDRDVQVFPFEYNRIRRVVVRHSINSRIGMGGTNRKLVRSELIWHHNVAGAMGMIQKRMEWALAFKESPDVARTIDEDEADEDEDEANTKPLSRYDTRVHPANPPKLKPRYARIKELGRGAFGVVWEAIDVDSGRPVALKLLGRPASTPKGKWTKHTQLYLKREVEILSRVRHPHIVEYISSCGWGTDRVEIAMAIKQGSLESFATDKCSLSPAELGNFVLEHMLGALDFLAYHGIVHRDVKPENILYEIQNGQVHFELGDFGLSNHQDVAGSFAGSPLYMAPEIFSGEKQTNKMDVWSLCVTMLWTMDVANFRTDSSRFTTPMEAQNAVRAVVAANAVRIGVPALRDMAIVNSQRRASAAQILVKYFDGVGLTTHRGQVPPLLDPPTFNSGPSAGVTPMPTGPAAPEPARPGKFRKRADVAGVVETAPFDAHRARRPAPLLGQPAGPLAGSPLGQVRPGPAANRPLPGAFVEDDAATPARRWPWLWQKPT